MTVKIMVNGEQVVIGVCGGRDVEDSEVDGWVDGPGPAGG